MRYLVVMLVLVGSMAYAEPSPAELLTRKARELAATGNCEAIKPIAREVRDRDPMYYLNVFAVDLRITRCVPRATASNTAPPRFVDPRPVEPVARGEKSSSTAVSISLGTTLGGVALGLLAAKVGDQDLQILLGVSGGLLFVLGPTLGHAYSGKTWNGGLGIRLASAGVAALGIALLSRQLDENEPGGPGLYLLGIAALGYGVGALYEIATAGTALESRVTVVPTAANHPGLSLLGRF